jgi:hypothetical protein
VGSFTDVEAVDGVEEQTLVCPDCGGVMRRRTSRFRYRDGRPKEFFGCVNWPVCSGIHSCHPDGSPMGTPADAATRLARQKLHATIDPLWQQRLVGRQEVYGLMAKWLGSNRALHIGEMDLAQINQVLRRFQKLRLGLQALRGRRSRG